MNRLKSLQIKKLFKELDYVESDFEYRNEIISESDIEFLNTLNNFLDKHPELKEIYNEKVDLQLNQNILKNTLEIIDSIGEESIDEKDPNVKKLYREIVKLTHPDKSNDKVLNEIYLNASKYYNIDDKIGIYKICSYLGIDYELDDDDSQIIEEKIDNFKRRIKFLENTFTWKWLQTDDDREKNELMINFIRMRIQ